MYALSFFLNFSAFYLMLSSFCSTLKPLSLTNICLRLPQPEDCAKGSTLCSWDLPYFKNDYVVYSDQDSIALKIIE